ncbi:hypothetical protein BR93DRAFT_369658 [Coniochaeta sp. PMI_546]|nr:hypothetical protein BR93DRAFT_369658 [Coniochaeta sp. PMI_546]
MGRTTKFTFPVPGRKQRKPVPSPPADISAPLTKAQKILGTGELNVDSRAISKDHSRFWETKSNSGISISISESTVSHANDTGLGRLDEGEVVHGVSGRHARFEDESAIIPRARHGTGSKGNTALSGAGIDTITDASSLRRQRSSSTINTYYDKSKVPLSISQQTASSAMAKGLPAKASALLDMDGSYPSQPKVPKKKPSRLDLSYLLPKSMSSKHLTPPDVLHKNLVLGPDLVTRSPSVMSVSPDIAPPPIQQRTDRKLRKKLTLETLRGDQLEQMIKAEESPAPKMRTASSVNELHNLYEHYEQRSFDEMMGTQPAVASTDGGSPRSPRRESSHPSAPGGRAFLSPYSNQASRTALASREGPISQASGAETPMTSLMTPSSLKYPPTDSASISSRHTRTSKASKRTDRSMTDLDLRQNSVLSLSSDSEDDYEDRPNTSLSAPRRPSDALPSPTSPNLSSFPQPPSPQAVEASSNNLPLRHAGPVSPDSRGQFVPLDSSSLNTGVTPPKIAARTSSLFASSGGNQKTVRSRFSLASTATAKSTATSNTINPARSEDPIQEFRPIAFIPAQGFRHGRNSLQQPPHGRAARLSNASDQSTPLSPTSIDFYLQSQHNSMAFDSGSIRSGMSMRSSIASSVAGDDGNGRFIAVTRQEEMLLAALRNKRARMRDEIIAEFDDEHDDTIVAGETLLHHPQPQHRYDQRTLQHLQNAPVQALPNAPTRQRVSSESKRSSGRQVSRNSSLSTVRLTSLPEQPHGEQQQQLQPPRLVTATPTLRKTRSNISSNSRHNEEQVLLCVDKMDAAIDLPEPSPDLDDFGDFDYLGGDIVVRGATSEAGSESVSGSASASGSGKSRTSSQLRVTDLFPAVPKGRNTSGNNSLPSLKSRFTTQQRRVDDVHVRIMGDGTDASSSTPDENDIPRPDSPISPVVDLPLPTSQLPKKKQVRLSAVGFRPMDASLWGDDG